MERAFHMGDTIKVSREAEALKILRMVSKLVDEGKTAQEIKEALETYVEAI